MLYFWVLIYLWLQFLSYCTGCCCFNCLPGFCFVPWGVLFVSHSIYSPLFSFWYHVIMAVLLTACLHANTDWSRENLASIYYSSFFSPFPLAVMRLWGIGLKIRYKDQSCELLIFGDLAMGSQLPKPQVPYDLAWPVKMIQFAYLKDGFWHGNSNLTVIFCSFYLYCHNINFGTNIPQNTLKDACL